MTKPSSLLADIAWVCFATFSLVGVVALFIVCAAYCAVLLADLLHLVTMTAIAWGWVH